METRITLLRHAKSESFSESNQDKNRQLSSKGRSDAALMGRVCSKKIPGPDLVLVSPALRTRETVELFLGAWGVSQTPIQIENSLYLASLEDWLRVVAQYMEKDIHVLACGHQPGIGELSARYRGTTETQMSTTSVVSLIFPLGTVDFTGSPREYQTQ